MSAATDAITALSTAVSAASPLADAATSTVNSLILQAQAAVTTIEGEITGYDAMMDNIDPSADMPADMVTALSNADSACSSQLVLVDARGLVGRALRNLQEV